MLNEIITRGDTRYIEVSGGYVALDYYEGFNAAVLGPNGISSEQWWQQTLEAVKGHTPQVLSALKERDRLHGEINQWYIANPSPTADSPEYPAYFKRYKAFLSEIGYLKDEVEDFTVETEGVDPEIATQAGAQLVVPLKIARYALNAVNARWGSLYDALYGSDMIPETGKTRAWRNGYNPNRGRAVIDFAKTFLDEIVPFEGASHKDVVQYKLEDGEGEEKALVARLPGGRTVKLKVAAQFVGYNVDNDGELSSIVLLHNGSHLEIKINRKDKIGSDDLAGVCGIDLEAADTVILDGEDSVEASSPQAKLLVHKNLAGILDGTLTTEVTKGGKSFVRGLNPDRSYVRANGGTLTLPGRARILIRNVGLHLFTNTVLDENFQPVPEGVFDIYAAGQIAANNLNSDSKFRNSAESIYFVQPKIQGDDEAGLIGEIVSSSERQAGISERAGGEKRYAIKIGLMDEERRTTLMLKNCISALRNRIFFINTGFLDRTGSEIFTAMRAGVFLPKAEIKTAPWLKAYEWWSVATGIICGLPGRAQIGKGMWDAPNRMREMYKMKRGHTQSGATTAWVPSPTAATIFSMMWHLDDAFAIQAKLAPQAYSADREAVRDQIMEVPLVNPANLTADKNRQELDSNIQSMLGYVVRWIDQGIGCSTVPDINDVGRMEDLATLRISRNKINNLLRHGVVSKEEVLDSIRRMTAKVDKQNVGHAAMLVWRAASLEVGSRKLGERLQRTFQRLWERTARDVYYRPMSSNLEGNFAVLAVRDLLFEEEANKHIFNSQMAESPDRFFATSAYDYTEGVLRHWRGVAERAYGGDRPPLALSARLALDRHQPA